MHFIDIFFCKCKNKIYFRRMEIKFFSKKAIPTLNKQHIIYEQQQKKIVKGINVHYKAFFRRDFEEIFDL